MMARVFLLLYTDGHGVPLVLLMVRVFLLLYAVHILPFRLHDRPLLPVTYFLQDESSNKMHAKQALSQAAALYKTLNSTKAGIFSKFTAAIKTAAQSAVQNAANSELPPPPSPHPTPMPRTTSPPTAVSMSDWLTAPSTSGSGASSSILSHGRSIKPGHGHHIKLTLGELQVTGKKKKSEKNKHNKENGEDGG
jgi:hypothetical protein